MKIRHLRFKVMSASIPMLVVAAVAMNIALNLFVLPGFQKIENESAIRNVGRAVDALNNSVDQLALKASDWGSWDDTYNFAVDHNKQYIKANLDNEALSNLQIDYMLFFNAKDQLIEMKHIDITAPNPVSLPLDQGVKDLFRPGSPLLQHSTIDDVHKGVIQIPEGIILLVSRPILNTQGEGPSHGSIVFGRYLDSDDQHKLADLTHLDLTYLAASDASVVKPASDYPSKTVKAKEWVSVLSDSQSRAFAIMPDIYGKPNIAVQVNLDRSITQQGRGTMQTFLLVSLLIGFLIIVGTALVLDRWIVRRIISLSNQLLKVEDIHDVSNAVHVSGDDELASLGATINNLLIRLHDVDILRQTNSTLEQEVEERTKELAEQLDQLKRTNDLMIDRELKMKELKQQNAKLRAENGDDSS